MKSSFKVVLCLVAAIVPVCLFGCSGGTAASYNLNKDASFSTDWGALLQYKIDSSWEEHGASSFVSYSGNNGFVGIDIQDTNSSLYQYSTDKSYADWQDRQREHGLDSGSDDIEYSNYSLEEAGTTTIDGYDFRLYKEKYTATYSDELLEKFKESDPNAQKTQENEMCHAVIKDGTHDMVITASSESLLNDFVKTMTIKW